MPDAARAKIEETIKRWRATAERYESDPKTGQGKKELLAKAKEWEAERDRAAQRDPNFDFAEALFQIAIVLGSVSIVAVSRPLLHLSGILAISRDIADDQRLSAGGASAAGVSGRATTGISRESPRNFSGS